MLLFLSLRVKPRLKSDVFLLLLGTVDVNVTPDKRKIFLDYEALLLATVKVR